MSIKVLYFTIVRVADGEQASGGNLCSQNHIIRMHQDPEIDLHVIVAGEAARSAGTLNFLERLGVKHRFVPYRQDPGGESPRTLFGRLGRWYRRAFNMPRELDALEQTHIEEVVLDSVRAWGIEAVVVEYLFSSLFCPALIRRGDNVLLITMNRECEYYGIRRRLRQVPHGRFTGAVSQWRVSRYEKWVYQRVKKVISIGPPDLPRSRVRSEPICVTPYLDPRPAQWAYTNSQSAFFVGALGHPPNRLAIEWIATRLVPEVARRRPDITFQIVGAEEGQVPTAWRHATVKYLGRSDSQQVQKLFTGCDLMLCPVENDFGMKFKAAEAIAHGTPLLASQQTLLGIPYLRDVPSLNLDDPQSAATLVCELVGQRDRLERISMAEREHSRAFIASQQAIWSTVIRSALGSRAG